MRLPLYFLSTLAYFWVPSAVLAAREWPRLTDARREAFGAALAVIWPMSVVMEYVYLHFQIWTFSERLDPLLGPRIHGAPIEEFCFWLGAPVFILLVYCAWRRGRREAPAAEAGTAAEGFFLLLADSVPASVPGFLAGSALAWWDILYLPFLAAFWWLYHAFRRRVSWRAAWLTVLVFEGVVFPAEVFSVHRGHWVYNEARILGPRLLGVPIEEPLLYYLFSPLIIVTVFEAWRALLGRRTA
ncbi:MAG: lycopene cyclase domain-containing protein [Elusimicrobia bacterium]|nr:lycopene cyclase domain-containing protein [Elusimicrobiota bacterium]